MSITYTTAYINIITISKLSLFENQDYINVGVFYIR